MLAAGDEAVAGNGMWMNGCPDGEGFHCRGEKGTAKEAKRRDIDADPASEMN